MDKTTKRRESEIFCLTSDNNPQRELTKSFSNVFYKFYHFFYILFFTVVVSYQTIFTTDKNNKHFVVFGFFLMTFFTFFFFSLFIFVILQMYFIYIHFKPSTLLSFSFLLLTFSFTILDCTVRFIKNQLSVTHIKN